MRAQIHQSGKTAHTRHLQIKQDQIQLAAGLEPLHHLLEGSGFHDLNAGEPAVDRLAQSAAKQRVIVRYQDPIRLRLGQSPALSLLAQDPQNCSTTSR